MPSVSLAVIVTVAVPLAIAATLNEFPVTSTEATVASEEVAS